MWEIQSNLLNSISSGCYRGGRQQNRPRITEASPGGPPGINQTRKQPGKQGIQTQGSRSPVYVRGPETCTIEVPRTGHEKGGTVMRWPPMEGDTTSKNQPKMAPQYLKASSVFFSFVFCQCFACIAFYRQCSLPCLCYRTVFCFSVLCIFFLYLAAWLGGFSSLMLAQLPKRTRTLFPL